MTQFNDVVLWLRTHSVIPMMLVFVVIAGATYWPGRRGNVERDGLIPFGDEK